MQAEIVREEVLVGDIVIIFGPPAGGKTAPSKLLERKHGLIHGNCYDIVMEDTAGSLREIADKAKLWADNTVNQAMGRYLPKRGLETGHILDGYPRTRGQARFVLGYARGLRARIIVVELKVPFDVCSERARARTEKRAMQGLPPRPDDIPEKHKERYLCYQEYSVEVLEYFREHNVPIRTVDGTRSEQEVCEEVEAIVVR